MTPKKGWGFSIQSQNWLFYLLGVPAADLFFCAVGRLECTYWQGTVLGGGTYVMVV